LKFGGLEVTTIASQEGGSQERQKLGVGTVISDAVREDRDIDLHRHFYLKLTDREPYGDYRNWIANPGPYVSEGPGRRPVRVFQSLLQGDDPKITNLTTACVYNRDGGRMGQFCETGRWRELPAQEFHYDEELRMLTVPGGNRNVSLAVRWAGDWIGS